APGDQRPHPPVVLAFQEPRESRAVPGVSRRRAPLLRDRDRSAPVPLDRRAAGHPRGVVKLAPTRVEPLPAHVEADEGPEPRGAGRREDGLYVRRIRQHLRTPFLGHTGRLLSLARGRRRPAPRLARGGLARPRVLSRSQFCAPRGNPCHPNGPLPWESPPAWKGEIPHGENDRNRGATPTHISSKEALAWDDRSPFSPASGPTCPLRRSPRK